MCLNNLKRTHTTDTSGLFKSTIWVPVHPMSKFMKVLTRISFTVTLYISRGDTFPLYTENCRYYIKTHNTNTKFKKKAHRE